MEKKEKGQFWKGWRIFLPLFLFLGVVLSSLTWGFPPPYYTYLVHEVFFVLLFFWTLTTVLKRYSTSLEMITVFLLFFLVVLPPVNTLLSPNYDNHFNSDPRIVDHLIQIGERPYRSENEGKAAQYIQAILEERGFATVIKDSNNNITVTVEGKKEDTVIFCAHYDTVPGSPGADDNASGVFVLLGLTIPENPVHSVELIFFTGEEAGLVESRRNAQRERTIAGVICVDTVGVGEDLYISCWKENRASSFFLSQLIYGLSDTGTPSIGPLYSDYVPFTERGIEAVGLTRATRREYPHIHSDMDTFVDESKMRETGETAQEVLDHFSSSEHPYRRVHEALVMTGIIAGVLTGGVRRAVGRTT